MYLFYKWLVRTGLGMWIEMWKLWTQQQQDGIPTHAVMLYAWLLPAEPYVQLYSYDVCMCHGHFSVQIQQAAGCCCLTLAEWRFRAMSTDAETTKLSSSIRNLDLEMAGKIRYQIRKLSSQPAENQQNP
jgi:hypothetical protein